MKIAVRKGMFETNSSSMHSLCIMKEDKKDYVTKETMGYWWGMRDGEYRLHEGELEFGREFEFITDFRQKCAYAIAAFGKEGAKVVEELLKELDPDFTSFELPTETEEIFILENGQRLVGWYNQNHMFEDGDTVWYLGEAYSRYDDKDVDLSKYPHKVKVIRNEENEKPYYGYIDHQSIGLLNGFIRQSGIPLKEFLLNKRYIIISDGDEYWIWDKIRKSDVTDSSKFYCYDGDLTEGEDSTKKVDISVLKENK